jgi:hypothetical protein
MSTIVRRMTLFGVAILLVGIVAWPAAAREPAQIRINKASSQLHDGNALIALRARCDANLAALELDVTVQQGTVIGEVSTVQAGRCYVRRWLASGERPGRADLRCLLQGARSGLRVSRCVRPERRGSGSEGLGRRASVAAHVPIC